MAQYFGMEDNIIIDYLQTTKTIKREYYCNLLEKLDVKIREEKTEFTDEKNS